MPRKKKLKQNPSHEIAAGPDGLFAVSVIVWYEDDQGQRHLDYIVGPFTSDTGAYTWAEAFRSKGRTCTVELLLRPCQELTDRLKKEGQ